MLRHPQTVARDMVVSVPAGQGTARALGMPVKFSGAPAAIERGAPAMGEHTEEVLRDYGFREDEIAGLLKSGAVGSMVA